MEICYSKDGTYSKDGKVFLKDLELKNERTN